MGLEGLVELEVLVVHLVLVHLVVLGVLVVP